MLEFFCSSRLLCVMVRECGMFMEFGRENIDEYFFEIVGLRLLVVFTSIRI